MNTIIKIVDTIEKTGEVVVNEVVKQTEITAKELLGDIKPVTDKELEEKKKVEEQKKQEELAKLRQDIAQGRKVESEMEKIRDEKKRTEEQKTKATLQAQQQLAQQQPVTNMEAVSANPAKRKKSRGSALMSGKQKKGQPDLQQMTQTGEVKGKIDN